MRVSGTNRNSEYSESPGNSVFLQSHIIPVSWSHRNFGFPESPGTPGSRSQPELLHNIVTGKPEFPDLVPGVNLKSGLRSHMEFQISGITRNTGFPESLGTPGSLSHMELRVSGVNQKFCVPGVTRNSRFPQSIGSPSSQVT